MNCQQCGQQNDDTAVFCMMCCAYLRLAARAVATAPAPAASPIVLQPSMAGAGAIIVTPSSNLGDAAGRAESHADEVQDFAGFGKRAVAYLWDMAVTFLLFMAVFIVGAGLHLIIAPGSRPPDSAALLVVTAYCVIYYLYHALAESSRRQATYGKASRGMKVTDLHGGRISFSRATGRHFAKFLSLLPLGIGFFMAGVHRRKQGLHDILAGCVVVNREGAKEPGRDALAADAPGKVTMRVEKYGKLLLLVGILAVLVYVYYEGALSMKSRINDVVTHGARARVAVTNYNAEQSGEFPASLAEVGVAKTAPHISRAMIEPQTNAIRIEVDIPGLQGSYFRFVPDTSAGDLRWRCDLGDIPQTHAEAICGAMPARQ
jgi:uncharacterized RDD family membrane protein YckC